MQHDEGGPPADAETNSVELTNWVCSLVLATVLGRDAKRVMSANTLKDGVDMESFLDRMRVVLQAYGKDACTGWHKHGPGTTNPINPAQAYLFGGFHVCPAVSGSAWQAGSHGWECSITQGMLASFMMDARGQGKARSKAAAAAAQAAALVAEAAAEAVQGPFENEEQVAEAAEATTTAAEAVELAQDSKAPGMFKHTPALDAPGGLCSKSSCKVANSFAATPLIISESTQHHEDALATWPCNWVTLMGMVVDPLADALVLLALPPPAMAADGQLPPVSGLKMSMSLRSDFARTYGVSALLSVTRGDQYNEDCLMGAQVRHVGSVRVTAVTNEESPANKAYPLVCQGVCPPRWYHPHPPTPSCLLHTQLLCRRVMKHASRWASSAASRCGRMRAMSLMSCSASGRPRASTSACQSAAKTGSTHSANFCSCDQAVAFAAIQHRLQGSSKGDVLRLLLNIDQVCAAAAEGPTRMRMVVEELLQPWLPPESERLAALAACQQPVGGVPNEQQAAATAAAAAVAAAAAGSCSTAVCGLGVTAQGSSSSTAGECTSLSMWEVLQATLPADWRQQYQQQTHPGGGRSAVEEQEDAEEEGVEEEEEASSSSGHSSDEDTEGECASNQEGLLAALLIWALSVTEEAMQLQRDCSTAFAAAAQSCEQRHQQAEAADELCQRLLGLAEAAVQACQKHALQAAADVCSSLWQLRLLHNAVDEASLAAQLSSPVVPCSQPPQPPQQQQHAAGAAFKAEGSAALPAAASMDPLTGMNPQTAAAPRSGRGPQRPRQPAGVAPVCGQLLQQVAVGVDLS